MRRIILLILIISFFGCCYAKDDVGSGDVIPVYPFKPKPKDLHLCNLPECVYNAGVLTITFEESEGRGVLTVTRMEDGMSASVAFYTFSTFTYNIGTAPGTYLLEIKTSKNCYKGTLTLEY